MCVIYAYAYWNASSSKSVRARILLLRVVNYVHSTTLVVLYELVVCTLLE